MVGSEEVGPRSLVQGLIPPRGRWPADQLAGGEGQGYPQLVRPAAARFGFFPLLFTRRWISV
jgi:hypothetical protein